MNMAYLNEKKVKYSEFKRIGDKGCSKLSKKNTPDLQEVHLVDIFNIFFNYLNILAKPPFLSQ